MVKIDLITGFLGAGKTTFLLKYCRYLLDKGLKIGILEYDFGAVNIDMVMLGKLRGPKCELEMLAAACDEDCLKRRFKTKLIAMAMSGYDRVIVEPSGLFDMDMFFDTLRDDPLDNWYEIGNVFTIVNANLKTDLDKEADYLLASQAAGAGTVILSRTQLSTKEEISATKEHLFNATAAIGCRKFTGNFFEKDWDDITDKDWEKLYSSGCVFDDYVKVIAGGSISFSSVSFLEIGDSLSVLKEKINRLFNDEKYGNIYRVKGYVSDEGVNYEINATKYEFTYKPSASGQNLIIVIGSNIDEKMIRELMTNSAF